MVYTTYIQAGTKYFFQARKKYFLSVNTKLIPSIYLYYINLGIYQVYTLNIQKIS